MKTKRIAAALLLTVILLWSMLFICASAQEAAVDGDEQEVEIPPVVEDTEQEQETVTPPAPEQEATPQPTVPADGGEGQNPTFVGRVLEFTDTYRNEIIGIVGFVGLMAATFVNSYRQKNNGAAVLNGVTAIHGSTSDVAASQNGVVGAVNEMIGAYNVMRSSYDTYAGAEDDRNKLVGAMVVQNAAILEILTTVYANSKNLPQGVKDLVNLKYAKCLAALQSDEKLKAFVASVKDVVNEVSSEASAEAPAQEEEAEAKEE